MQGTLLVLIPAIIISLGISAVKFKYPSFNLLQQSLGSKLPIKLVIMLILAISSTFVIDYIYCNLLQTECKPDALASIGYFFHAVLVFISSILLESFFLKCFQKLFKSSS